MSVEFNHTIIWARDKAKSAAFLAGILDLPVGQQWGPFVPVQVSNGVTLDYADPYHRHSGEINYNYGGRGVHFNDPDGHNMELMTTPYGAIPAH